MLEPARTPGELALHLLTACIVRVTTGNRRAVADLLIGTRPDWILFLTLTLEHNLAGVTAQALADGVAGTVPPPVLQQFELHARHAAQANRAALQRTAEIGTALHRAGIASMPLKGPWLALRAFGGLAARPSRDIDILVPTGCVAAALAVIDRLGYDADHRLTPAQFAAELRNNCEFIFFHRDDASAIEPHWAVTPRSLAVAVDMNSLWRRACPVKCDGCEFLTAQPEDEALLLCLHGGKEEWVRLKWRADLSAFTASHPGLDGPILRERADAQHALGYLLLGVRLLDILLGHATPLSGEAAATAAVVHHAQAIRARIHAAADSRRGCPQGHHIQQITRLRLDLHRRWADKARVVWRSLFTPRRQHYMILRLPGWLAWLYPLLKFSHDSIALPMWLLLRRPAQPEVTRPERRA